MSNTSQSWHKDIKALSIRILVVDKKGWLVGWKIKVTFQHKNRLNQGQGLEWRFSSAQLRMANDTVDLLTSLPFCSVTTQNVKE